MVKRVAWVAAILVLGPMIMPSALRPMLLAQVCSPAAGPLIAPPQFFVPIELGQGPMFTPGPDQYIASLRLHPTLGIDQRSRFRIGLTGAAVYFASDVEVLAGGRVSYAPFRFLDVGGSALSVNLAAEALAGTGDRRLVGGGIIADIFGALQVTARVARELEADVTVLELAAGTDIRFWTRPPATRPPRQPVDPFPGLTGFLRMLAIEANITVNELCEPGREQELAQARAIVDEASTQPTLDALVTFVRGRGLPDLADIIDDVFDGVLDDARRQGELIPDTTDPGTQRQIVGAIIVGWRLALNIQP